MSTEFTSGDSEPLPRFEVDMASDEPMQILALQGLSQAYGWSLRDLNADPHQNDPVEITVASLVETSSSLFEVERYGRQAHALLYRDRAKFTGAISRHDKQLIRFNDVMGGLPTSAIANEPISRREIKDVAQELLLTLHPPFSIAFDVQQPEISQRTQIERLYNYHPGEVTRQRLRDHLTSLDYQEHGLHGLFGKAIDVLNTAADLADIRSIEQYNPDEFVGLDKVVRRAKEEGLSQGSIKSMVHRLRLAVNKQLASGQPLEEYGGEVIIENGYEHRESNPNQQASIYVALSSLVQLGETAPLSAKYAPILKNAADLLI